MRSCFVFFFDLDSSNCDIYEMIDPKLYWLISNYHSLRCDFSDFFILQLVIFDRFFFLIRDYSASSFCDISFF